MTKSSEAGVQPASPFWQGLAGLLNLVEAADKRLPKEAWVCLELLGAQLCPGSGRALAKPVAQASINSASAAKAQTRRSSCQSSIC
jgi:hypothetical protein